jgi:hypothetical protein
VWGWVESLGSWGVSLRAALDPRSAWEHEANIRAMCSYTRGQGAGPCLCLQLSLVNPCPLLQPPNSMVRNPIQAMGLKAKHLLRCVGLDDSKTKKRAAVGGPPPRALKLFVGTWNVGNSLPDTQWLQRARGTSLRVCPCSTAQLTSLHCSSLPLSLSPSLTRLRGGGGRLRHGGAGLPGGHLHGDRR